MITSNADQAFGALKRRLTRAELRLSSEVDGLADDLGRRFLAEMQQRQPDGSQHLDPMVPSILKREPRPSVRQGLVPIAKGWTGPRVERPSVREWLVRIGTVSPHMHYFTQWTGRKHLGTRGGKPIVAKRAKTLAFWWKGAAHFPVVVRNHEGFRLQSDFVQDAWDSMEGWVTQRQRQIRGLVVEAMKNG